MNKNEAKQILKEYKNLRILENRRTSFLLPLRKYEHLPKKVQQAIDILGLKWYDLY